MIGGKFGVGDEVRALHQELLVFDLHNDLLTKLTHSTYDVGRRHGSAAFWNPLRLDLDLPRIREARIDALGCLMFSGFRVARSRRFWRQLDRARDLVATHPKDLMLARCADDVRTARADGRVALVLGVEGSYGIDDDLDAGIARLADAGVWFLGPLWERDSAAGTSCRTTPDRGLSEHGRRLVRECNRHHILLDVAHASRRTFWDMDAVSATPIFSSHSAADAVHGHARNLDDDQLRAIGRKGGVVGVIFVSTYVGGTFCDLARVADHIEHVAKVAGEEAVALGSDFDGFMPLPRGLRDAADLPRLTQILWDRGWRRPQLARLLGDNALAYFQRHGRPSA